MLDWAKDSALASQDPWVTKGGHCWMRAHRFSRFRYPCNDQHPVEDAELRELFWRGAPVVMFFEETTEELANSHLYLCRDREYKIEKLSSNNRSKVRRGLKRFQVREVTGDEIARNGYECYLGTHERNDLATRIDRAGFERFWRERKITHIESVFAAIAADGNIGAYLTIRRLGRWAEIVAASSATKALPDYPNHALMFHVLQHFLVTEGAESVSYGLGSLQTSSNSESLHHFKRSVGFEAIPVRRKVRFHPIIRPVIGEWLRPLATAAERAFPKNRRVRAAAGAVKLVLGERPDGRE